MQGIFSLKSITPNSGSIYGGTVVVLDGNGFTLNSTVKLGSSSTCKVVNASINSISCITSDSSQAQQVNVQLE